MRNSKIRVKEILSPNAIQYLSSHEISDIIGNYSKEDFCVDRKSYNRFSFFNLFALLQV